MVNIANAVRGGILEYGSNMNSDQILQDWLNSHQRKLSSSMGEGFVSTGSQTVSIDGTLLENVEIELNTGESDLNLYIIKNIVESRPEKPEPTDWLSYSSQMIEAAKLMGNSQNQKLLALALSISTGKPLRYCIQDDVVPSITYWNYYAENLYSHFNQKSQDITMIIVEPTDQPILDICRAICPISRRGQKIILLPVQQLALPCLVLAEIIRKAGLECCVYVGNRNVRNMSANKQTNIDVIFSGCRKMLQNFPSLPYNLKLNAVGKKAIVAMETGDCDGAVDAAITALKCSVSTSSGLYMIAHDSLLEDIKWRLKDRLARCKVGHYLDKMTDVVDHPEFAGSQQIADCLKRTNLDVMKVGNAQVIFNAQLSLPLTQMDNVGQTLMVLSYRSVSELGSILTNISSLSELSLWVDHQGAAWQIIHQIQVQRVWVNGIGSYEPGFNQLIPIQQGVAANNKFQDEAANAELYPQLDALRVAQRNWSAQGKKNLVLTQFLKLLAVHPHFSAIQGPLFELVKIVNSTSKGNVVEGFTKNSTVFDLKDAVGLLAMVIDIDTNLESMLSIMVVALLHGNAIIVSNQSESSSISEIIKAAKQSGLSSVILSVPSGGRNERSLMKHHAVRKIICTSDDFAVAGGLQAVWNVPESSPLTVEEIINHVTLRKRVWMTFGDGLAN